MSEYTKHQELGHEIGTWGECLEEGCDYGHEDAYWNKIEAGYAETDALPPSGSPS